MKQALFAIMMLIIISSLVLSEIPSKPVLDRDDVLCFVETYPELKKDMKQLKRVLDENEQ